MELELCILTYVRSLREFGTNFAMYLDGDEDGLEP